MNRCKDCKHYRPATDRYWAGLGWCDRWKQGYGVERYEVADNEVVVENDEGWGMYMGPDFGCVLHESR